MAQTCATCGQATDPVRHLWAWSHPRAPGGPSDPMTTLYAELTNATMTWTDAVFWLVIGAVGGGGLTWSVMR